MRTPRQCKSCGITYYGGYSNFCRDCYMIFYNQGGRCGRKQTPRPGEMVECIECHRSYPFTDEFFKRRSKGSLRRQCRPCFTKKRRVREGKSAVAEPRQRVRNDAISAAVRRVAERHVAGGVAEVQKPAPAPKPKREKKPKVEKPARQPEAPKAPAPVRWLVLSTGTPIADDAAELAKRGTFPAGERLRKIDSGRTYSVVDLGAGRYWLRLEA